MIPAPVETRYQSLNFLKITPRISLLLLGASIALGFFSFAFMFFAVAPGYPIYCREAHDVFSTSLLLQGKNPYSIDQHPALMHCYGIVHSLIGCALGIFFGYSVQLQRLISSTAIWEAPACFTGSCEVAKRRDLWRSRAPFCC